MSNVKKNSRKAKQSAPMCSTTTAAKKIIRDEIKFYYSPKRKHEGKSALDNMQKAANSYSAGRGKSDWGKGAALVDAACFAVWEQDEMLSKIYGHDKVKNWDNEKKHNVYRNLIGREYAAMLSEREKAKVKKAQERAKAKSARTSSAKSVKSKIIRKR